MQWDSELDDELEEYVWCDWPYILPAIERACAFEDRMDQLEQRVRQLEGRPKPDYSAFYGSGPNNRLLQHVKEKTNGPKAGKYPYGRRCCR